MKRGKGKMCGKLGKISQGAVNTHRVRVPRVPRLPLRPEIAAAPVGVARNSRPAALQSAGPVSPMSRHEPPPAPRGAAPAAPRPPHSRTRRPDTAKKTCIPAAENRGRLQQ